MQEVQQVQEHQEQLILVVEVVEEDQLPEPAVQESLS
jgi:hypothetical protein